MQYLEPSVERLPGHSPKDAFLDRRIIISPAESKMQPRWSPKKSGSGGWVRQNDVQKSKSFSSDRTDFSKAKPERKVSFFNGTSPSSSPVEKGKKASKSWDFGKIKTFSVPVANAKTKKAAVHIQRMMRGWWQRLRFRVAILQHMMDTRYERTRAAIAKVYTHNEKAKLKYKAKMQERAKDENEKVTMASEATQESQRLIAYLRKENKTLREKNEKIFGAICSLKEQNERLESANSLSGDSFSTLNQHAAQIKDTHAKLQEIVPKYKESVDKLKEAAEVRRQYCLCEHKIRVMYAKVIGTIVEAMESSCKDKSLVDEAVGYVLEMEGHDENPVKCDLRPPSQEEEEAEHDDEDAEYDEFTVATLE